MEKNNILYASIKQCGKVTSNISKGFKNLGKPFIYAGETISKGYFKTVGLFTRKKKVKEPEIKKEPAVIDLPSAPVKKEWQLTILTLKEIKGLMKEKKGN